MGEKGSSSAVSFFLSFSCFLGWVGIQNIQNTQSVRRRWGCTRTHNYEEDCQQTLATNGQVYREDCGEGRGGIHTAIQNGTEAGTRFGFAPAAGGNHLATTSDGNTDATDGPGADRAHTSDIQKDTDLHRNSSRCEFGGNISALVRHLAPSDFDGITDKDGNGSPSAPRRRPFCMRGARRRAIDVKSTRTAIFQTQLHWYTLGQH